jgi:hypothetical protein
MSLTNQQPPVNMASFANKLLSFVGRYPQAVSADALSATICRELVDRVQSVQKTPLDLAAEALKDAESCITGHKPFAYWKAQALAIVRDNREDRSPVERLVIRTYNDAMVTFRAHSDGEVA